MLFFLLNRVETTFAVTAAGIYTFRQGNSKIILFRLTTKTLINSWMASFTSFCCDIMFRQYPHKKVQHKICKRLGLLKSFDTVEKTWLGKNARLTE